MCNKLIYLTFVVLVIGFLGLCPGQAQEVDNIMENGGFETGDLTAWTGGGGIGSTMTVVNTLVGTENPEDPIEGDYCLHISVQEEGPNPWDSQLKYNGLIFEEGKQYTLSAFIKSDDEIEIRFNPQLSQDPYTAYGAQNFIVTNEWQEYYITTPVMTETVDPANIDFHFNYSVGEFWIDDVKWYEGEYVPTDTSVSYQATDPIPGDGTLLTDFPGGLMLLGTTLRWTAGSPVVTHDVYFGTNYNDVKAGTGGTFRGNEGVPYFYVGYGFTENDPAPDGLVPGTTYYWRIDEVDDTDPNSPWIGEVWSFSIPDTKAYSPNPPDDAQFIDPNADLNWEPALGGIRYTVYFGDDYNTVESTTEGGTVVGIVTTYDHPDPLELDKVYYWRVDTDGAYGQFKGDVWNFRTTVPSLGKIVQELWFNISEWSVDLLTNDPRYPHSPDETTEITAFDTGTELGDNYGGRIHGWLYVPATGDYIFWLCTDDQGELWLSTNDDPSNMERIARESSYRGYDSWGAGEEQSDPIHLVAGNKYYIMALWKEGESGDHCQVAWQGPGMSTLAIIPGSNLSPYKPVSAFGPKPDNGAGNVTQTPVLEWKPGIQAASHQIYFGTDAEAVRNATTASPEYIDTRALGSESYTPNKLDWASTYYWRIDEVNTLHPESPWKGSVWSFTTADYAIVDDFEDYNVTDRQIWAIWHDGLGYWDLDGLFHPGNETGAAVGDEDNDNSYMEETIVRPGSTMSMPYFFDNNLDPPKMKYSEAKMTLIAPRDWTDGGAKALSLWFHGTPGSVGSFTDNFDGTYTMTASGADITGPSDEFHFAYKPLTGVGTIVARVDSMDNTDPWAKAGVMIRESLDPNSTHAMVFVTPENGVVFEYRPAAGQDNVSVAGQQTGITAPQWVRLSRDISGLCSASYSSDGQNWNDVGIPQNVPMGVSKFVGLAVTAHNAALTCQVEFSNVQVSVSGPWLNQDIGILSNDEERMYVAIANSNGTTGTVYYEDNDNIDTSAILIDAWTQWNIDLKDFQDQGVNLADVNSIAIGIGTRGSTTAGGTGKVYFEDIRLYKPRYIPGKGTPIAADFSGDGVVDYRDVETMANDWLMQDDTVTTANPGTANLVAYYPLDEGAGTVAGDSAGGHNGTVVGGAQWIAGPDGFGSALHFDGTSQGQYVDLGTWNPSAGTGQLTVCLWAKWDGLSDYYQGLIAKRDTWAEDEMMWQIEANQADGNVGASRESGQYVGGFIPQIGQWEHVALSFDGTTATLYRYGLQVASGPFSLGPDTGAALVFGACEANGGNPYNGAIDEVRIYNRALSQAEIAYLISDGTPTLYVPVLSAANLSDDEPEGSKVVNFKDFAIFADMWLDEQLWPEW